MLCRILLTVIALSPSLIDAAEPPITAIAFAPDGKSVVVGSQSGVRIVSWPELEQHAVIESSLSQIHDLAFSPDRFFNSPDRFSSLDSAKLVVVGGSPSESGGVEFFWWPTPRLMHATTVGEDVLYQARWQPHTSRIMVAGPDHSITRLGSIEQPTRIEGHSRDVVAVEVLGHDYFASGSRDGTIRVWNESSNELVRTLNNHTNELHDIVVRPGSNEPPFVLASSSEDRTVRFWWPVRGRLMRFAKLPSPALDIEWTASGDRLIAACADGHVRVIDPDTVQIVRDIEVSSGWLYALAVSPDEKQAVVGGAGGLLKAVTIR